MLINKFHDYFTQDANACVSLGVSRHLDDLPDPSLDNINLRVIQGKKLLAEIQSFPRNGMEFDELLDLDLARLAVEFEIFSDTYVFNGKTQMQQTPTAGDDISDGLFFMFINDPRPVHERLDNMTARLEKVPQYLDKLIDRLDTPVKRWVEMDIEKVEGLPDLFNNIYSWAEDNHYGKLNKLAAAKKQAEFSLVKYIEKLRAIPTTTNMFIGTEQTRSLVKLRGIDKSLEELHAMTAEFLRDTTAVIHELHSRLLGKYNLPVDTSVDDLHSFLNHKFQVKLEDSLAFADIINRYKNERDCILKYIKEKDLFPIFKEQSMLIMQTPAFMAPSIPAGAMVSPPPFRAGEKISIIYLTLSEELLAEHTELSIPSMMIHEGIPGHHLQLSSACNHRSIVRRHFDALEQSEGWTTMLEDYMLDLGYMGELTDEARFIGKRDICRIGARVAIDLYFMTGDKKYLDIGVEVDISSHDAFINAGNLLQKVTGFTPGRVQAELNWYSQERAYPLCYLTGNKLVWELKADLAKAQKGKLEGVELDRVFHKVYLDSGNMPVKFLRLVFENRSLL